MSMSPRATISSLALFAAIAASAVRSADANLLVDGSFENQATLQSNPFYLQADGSKWGAAWSNWGWSSWQENSVGAWTGGAIARTEEYAAGWKWAHTGDVFGIIKDRGTMSQTFTATESGEATVSWFDANRASWRELDWFGRENNYSVTLTDSLGNVQNVGSYTSVVAGGNSYSSPAGNGWWTLAGKQGWFERFGATVTLQAGMTYTLSFNSLSPYIYDDNGNITGVEDRTTFLDDINVSMGVVPSPGALAVLGLGALGARRRR